jgi:hypothetical protein
VDTVVMANTLQNTTPWRADEAAAPGARGRITRREEFIHRVSADVVSLSAEAEHWRKLEEGQWNASHGNQPTFERRGRQAASSREAEDDGR